MLVHVVIYLLKELDINDIYGRLIDTHRKAILCYRRILYNIKNRYENDEQQKKLGYKTLNNLFREFDRLLNTTRSADEILHFLEGRATLRLNIDGGTTKKKSVIVVKDLLNGNYEVNLDKSTDDDDNDIGDDDSDMLDGETTTTTTTTIITTIANDDGDDRDGISIEYILENRSHLINTLEYFKQNIDNLEESAESLDLEKAAFLKFNKKYTVVFELIKRFYSKSIK